MIEGMLLTVVVVALLTAYYFGVRPAAWAAAATVALSVLALVLPRYATAIHVVIAAFVVGVWQVGKRRPRPPEAVFAVAMLRRAAKQLWSRLSGKD